MHRFELVMELVVGGRPLDCLLTQRHEEVGKFLLKDRKVHLAKLVEFLELRTARQMFGEEYHEIGRLRRCSDAFNLQRDLLRHRRRTLLVHVLQVRENVPVLDKERVKLAFACVIFSVHHFDQSLQLDHGPQLYLARVNVHKSQLVMRVANADFSHEISIGSFVDLFDLKWSLVGQQLPQIESADGTECIHEHVNITVGIARVSVRRLPRRRHVHEGLLLELYCIQLLLQ